MLLTDLNIAFKSEASVVLFFASIHFPFHPVLPFSFAQVKFHCVVSLSFYLSNVKT